MPLWRKYNNYRENYPHVKCLDNIFAKFSPSENNHVYSTYKRDILFLLTYQFVYSILVTSPFWVTVDFYFDKEIY